MVPEMRNARPILLALLLLNSVALTGSLAAAQDDDEPGKAPEDLWSIEYVSQSYPWGGDSDAQFDSFHDFLSMRQRMQYLAERNPEIFEFHDGMPGGVNDRGVEMDSDSYKGWFYKDEIPWMKITGGADGVEGGTCDPFVGDCGNYADRPDVLLVGVHHAREWMGYEVAMLFLETIAHYYGMAGVDNDGDGLIDEDPWGDADGDGVLDDDGDCLMLNESYQDSNGDGTPCGPGDLGVDEDFSEQWITDLVDTREIYLVPMLNVDGNRYDREEFCSEEAWESCPSGGWRKNLRDNTYTGTTPFPDLQPGVDEDCDGVDLNRNYQFEWGWPLGATLPLIPGTCTPSEDERAGIANNDVYTGPFDTIDNDGDNRLNEDHVDGKDDDADGLVDEDWDGGNSEPETLFMQDMTEMNDDDGDGASDFKATLTWHSYSELVLWPWGHCTGCSTTDEAELVYHGVQMAEMSGYDPMQSSDLYPTTGDFCDWHYGVHQSFCYTIEIGTAFHQRPEDINHIAVRNLGMPFYLVKFSDNPVERARVGLENWSRSHWITPPANVSISENGPIPIEMCIGEQFPWSSDINASHLTWRMVKPSRIQSDYGPTEWLAQKWQKAPFEETGEQCVLADGNNGSLIVSDVPVPDDISGQLHYKAALGTMSGTYPFQYPAQGQYHTMTIPYRAAFGNTGLAIMLALLVATAVWGGLGVALRLMMDSGKDEPALSQDEAH